jgi:hypothetical protein
MHVRQCLRPGALAPISSIMLTAAVGLTSLLGPAMGVGADAPPMMDEKFPDLAASINTLRAEVGQDRRNIVAAAMSLTKSEGEIFWPLYDKYRAEQHRLGDQKVELITVFISTRDTMSEEAAGQLTHEALLIEKNKLAIKEEYISKMTKVLSERTVARFFQIDNKLDSVVDVALASRVPLTSSAHLTPKDAPP